MPKSYREVMSLSLKKSRGDLKAAHLYRKQHYRKDSPNRYIRRYRRVEKPSDLILPKTPPSPKLKPNQNEYETTKYYRYDEKTFQVRVTHTKHILDSLSRVNNDGERLCDLAFEERIGSMSGWESWSVGTRTLRENVIFHRSRYVIVNMRTHARWSGSI